MTRSFNRSLRSLVSKPRKDCNGSVFRGFSSFGVNWTELLGSAPARACQSRLWLKTSEGQSWKKWGFGWRHENRLWAAEMDWAWASEDKVSLVNDGSRFELSKRGPSSLKWTINYRRQTWVWRTGLDALVSSFHSLLQRWANKSSAMLPDLSSAVDDDGTTIWDPTGNEAST